jgi:hypothetical protein
MGRGKAVQQPLALALAAGQRNQTDYKTPKEKERKPINDFF